MAENDQHLKHGKALCGKVFGRFVETFNALVDFMLGIKGDADGKNGEGHITYDRKNNIIRCDGCGGENGGDTAPLPWTFSCTEDPDTGERTGGWSNGRLQIGYDCGWGTPDVAENTSHRIADCDTCDDGYHAIEIDLNQMTAKVIVNYGSSKPSEYGRGIVSIFIGYVQEGKLIYGIHMNPVCYHIL